MVIHDFSVNIYFSAVLIIRICTNEANEAVRKAVNSIFHYTNLVLENDKVRLCSILVDFC